MKLNSIPNHIIANRAVITIANKIANNYPKMTIKSYLNYFEQKVEERRAKNLNGEVEKLKIWVTGLRSVKRVIKGVEYDCYSFVYQGRLRFIKEGQLIDYKKITSLPYKHETFIKEPRTGYIHRKTKEFVEYGA